MNTILKRNYINSLKAEENQLCNCNCDLQVLKEIMKEKENKIDELDKKFMPYIFENRIKVLHCKDCDTIYLMKSKYEASSKIDFEEIECILKKDYFKAKEYINRLEERYITEDSYIICIDEYIIKFIKHINNEKFSSRIVSFENTEVDYNYISNKKLL